MSTGVLIVDEENGAKLLQQRFRSLGFENDLPIYFLTLTGFKLNEGTVKEIIDFSKNNGIGLVIFDSLIRIHNEDENSAKDMAKVFKHLKELTKHSLTVVCTHHNRKQGLLTNNPSQSIRGSSDILASVDCHLAVERNEKEGTLTLRQTKLRHGLEMKPFKLNIVSDENSFNLEYASGIEDSKTLLEETKQAILELFKREDKELFKKEIQDLLSKTGFSAGRCTVNNAIDELTEEGCLHKKKGVKNKTLFSLVKE